MSDISLSDVATQAGFARLVGTSRQAINKQVDKGVLPDGGTYSDWIACYTEHLREEAAGRGENHGSLTAVRIQEGIENIAEKRQRRLTAAGDLIDREQVEQWVTGAAGNIQTYVMGAGETILESLSEKYGLEVDSDDVIGILRTALGHAGKAGEELAQRFTAVGSDSSTVATDADSLMG